MAYKVYPDPIPMTSWIYYRNNDFKVMSSGFHSAKLLSTIAGYSLVAMVTDI